MWNSFLPAAFPHSTLTTTTSTERVSREDTRERNCSLVRVSWNLTAGTHPHEWLQGQEKKKKRYIQCLRFQPRTEPKIQFILSTLVLYLQISNYKPTKFLSSTFCCRNKTMMAHSKTLCVLYEGMAKSFITPPLHLSFLLLYNKRKQTFRRRDEVMNDSVSWWCI